MPEPRDEHVRRRFRVQRVRDTKPELAVRSAVHATGLRYTVDTRPEPDLRVRADLVFRSAKVVVFIDGCFWHGCPQHFIPPKNNAEWWRQKILANQARDARYRVALGERGWLVISLWEHESPTDAVTSSNDEFANELNPDERSAFVVSPPGGETPALALILNDKPLVLQQSEDRT